MKKIFILTGSLLVVTVLILSACQGNTPTAVNPTKTTTAAAAQISTTPALVTTRSPVSTSAPNVNTSTASMPTTTTTVPQATDPFPSFSYQMVWHAGDTDVNGNAMYGTELMRILPYKGKLYASTSMWMESDPSVPKACQLLVLDSPDSSWKVFHQFTTNNLRLVVLQTVTFTTDGRGNKIEPVTMLLTAPDVNSGNVQIYSLDDNTGELIPMTLGRTSVYATTRAIGSHHDAVTGVDMVFAGNDVLGMFSGTYDASVPGRIKWRSSPELSIPTGERMMGFAECDGSLYGSTSRHIYKRIDGPSPTWREVYYCPQETSPSGIRGLTAVPNPSGKGEVLLFGALSAIRHIDPADNYKETVELDMRAYLGKLWNTVVTYVLPAYNDFLPYTVPGTGEKVYLFGFESAYSPSQVQSHPEWHVFRTPGAGTYAAEAHYFIRHTTANGVSFEVAEVTDPALPTLVSVRTIAVSPFSADKGQVLYFGGFDCNSKPSHDTGWVYRGLLKSK